MVTYYALDEVEKHNIPSDIWMIIHNKVYNVTGYLSDHPGGADVLKEVAGVDASSAFEDIGHSDEAREQLGPLLVGEVAQKEQQEVVEIYRPTFEKVSQVSTVQLKGTKSSGFSLAKVAAGALVLGGAGYYAYNGRGLNSTHVANLQKWYSQAAVKGSTSPTPFWQGVAITFAANVSIFGGMMVWLSQRLDAQVEFTHRPAHKPVRRDLVIQVKPKQVKVPTLHPLRWKKFPLSKKEKLSSNVYKLTFALPTPRDVLGLPIGQHIAIRADIDGKSVQRSYTPTSNDTDLGRIELVIKVYQGGLITNYLAGLDEGDDVEIRGPKGAMTYSKNLAKHIGMIAGGTGITPMYQLIRAICSDPNDKTTVSLLYANNTVEDILLREELEGFAEKNPEKFKLQHVLSRPAAGWTGASGFITPELIEEHLPAVDETTKIMLCGPAPMINAMKKNLDSLGFKPPSAISKMSDQIFLF